MKYTIAVDFDGVIHQATSPWTGFADVPDPPVEGAIEWLNKMCKHFRVVIHSCRAATVEGAGAIVGWLHQNGYDVREEDVTNVKPPALIYLDDRAVRFTGNFPSLFTIHHSRPWNRPSKLEE